MRVFSLLTRACLAGLLGAALPAVPAAASLAESAVSVFGRDAVTVGPGAAPKPVTFDVNGGLPGEPALDVVLTIDATAAPADFAVVLPGAAEGCAVTGRTARCTLDRLDWNEGRGYTVGVAAAPGAAASATGTITAVVTAANAPREGRWTMQLTLGPAGVDLVLAAVPIRPLLPGQSADLPVVVRNEGGVAARGVVVTVDAAEDDPVNELLLLSGPRPACAVSRDRHHMTCTYDTVVEPGATFTPPVPLRVRLDPVTPGGAAYSLLVRVTPVAAADLNDDNSRYVMYELREVQPADAVAVGAAVEGRVGDKRRVTVRVRNDGPAALATSDGAFLARVRLPAGLRVTRACANCRPVPVGDEWPPIGMVRGLDYWCQGPRWIVPGDAFTCRFDVRITGGTVRPGSVSLVHGDNAGQDPDLSNNTAPIMLVITGGAPTPGGGGGGAGLPITGAPASSTAVAGVLFLLVGAAAMVLGRRRP